MRPARVTPNGRQTTFGPEEIIVSKTDPAGRITYVNDVFTRVSGYTEAQLLGQPHNLIRHPEMPRAIFKLLWDTLEQGREVFAYIDNLAADGSHYWVLAHVTPTYARNGQLLGYHSNRRCPDRSAVTVVAGLYRRLLTVERAQPSSSAALAASAALLSSTLTGLGLTYDELVWQVINGTRKAL